MLRSIQIDDRVRAALRSPEPLRRLFDFIYAGLLFRLPRPVRRRLFAGERHFCPICGSRLRRFLVLHRAYHLWCPVCRSLQRHRLVWLLLQREWQERLRPGVRLLHLAPEPALAAHFRRLAGEGYVSGDLSAGQVMVKLDVAALPFAAASFDLLYCSHVLEHVPDDRAALVELRRVLAPDGQALLLVPITAAETEEDPTLADPVERERRFGQHDHVRRYGPDFAARMAAAGFQVRRIQTEELADPTAVRRFGLTPGEVVFLGSPAALHP